jgi:hypothetical protein
MKRLKIALLIFIGIIFSLTAALSTSADPYIYHPYYAYDQYPYHNYYNYIPVNYLYNGFAGMYTGAWYSQFYYGARGYYNNYYSGYYNGYYNNYYRGYGGYGGYGYYGYYYPKPVYNPSRWWAW